MFWLAGPLDLRGIPLLGLQQNIYSEEMNGKVK